MRKRLLPFFILAIAFLLSASSFAWETATQQAVVTTAVHVLSKEGVVQLSKLERDVRDGAAASPDFIAGLYPGYASDPVRAIETEMHLLDTVRTDVVDPYYAYRLGALGRLVASLTAPLLTADRSIRDKYYADVEKYMKQVQLKPSVRRLVDPAPYFERMRRLADARKDMIQRDYKDGVGFDGIAKATISEELSRSIDAVADVWNTIMTQTVVHANVSDEQVRGYVLAAIEYYVKRNNEGEIDANYRRLTKLTKKTSDLAKRIGDMFYDGGLYERAIAEYQEVLSAEPQRRDVIARIADYYIKQGDAAAKAKRLQQAYEFYQKAAKTDPLHPDAERKRLDCESQIAERDARLDAAKRGIEEGAQLETDAEQLVLQSRVADAMATLQRAQEAYQTVTDEFPTESRAAGIGIANIVARLRDLKGQLTQNAQMLTGVGFLPDMQRLAATSGAEIDDLGLHGIMKAQRDAHIESLKTQYRDKFAITPGVPR